MSTVDAAIEREMDRWRKARARQALIAGRWGMPPPVPVVGDWRAVFDPTGRYALLIGYRAVHLLDLRTARTRVLIRDARYGREGAFDPEGRCAVVVDGYSERLYRIDLVGEPRVESHRWACPGDLRGELAVAVDAAGIAAVVGRDLDDVPLRVHWLDIATGETLYTREIPAEHIGIAGVLGGLRMTGNGVHLWPDDPEAKAVEVGPDDAIAHTRPSPCMGGRPGAPWCLVGSGKRRQLTRPGGPAIEIWRPRGQVVVSDGPDTDRLAVAVDGRVRVYATATGERIGQRVEPPGRQRFARVVSMLLTGERLWVYGEAPTSPFGAEPQGLVAAYRLEGDRWRRLGVVVLAGRVMAAKSGGRSRGERASNVFMGGKQLTVAELEAKGIHFTGGGDAEGEAAQARFACAADDTYGREVPFVRTPAGLFGRLDSDRPLGPETAAPFERPVEVRGLLIGETPVWDAATRAGLDDWRDRLAFWRSDPAWAKPAALGQLMEASAGLGDLLPEVVHRAPRGKRGRPPTPRALCRVAERMTRKASVDREETIFREMLARERRTRRPALLRARLQQACPTLSSEIVQAAVEGLGDDVEAIAAAAASTAPTLVLHGISAGGPLADLLAAISGEWAIEHLDLTGCDLGDAGLMALAEARWPTLRHLDLSHTGVTDRGALALAAAHGLPALATVVLDGTPVTHRGRAALRWSPRLPALKSALSLLAGWVGLLEAHDDAAPMLPGMLDAVWTATIERGGAVDLVEPPEWPESDAQVRWSTAPRTLEIEGISVSSAGLAALVDGARTPGLDRMALRRCTLDDAANESLMALMARLGEGATLDLSHNRLGRAFALRCLADGVRGCALDLTGNPIDPGGWGVLRAVAADRVSGIPDDAAQQLAAAARLDWIDLDTRAGWLGQGFAADPDVVGPTLTALVGTVADRRRGVLASPAIGEPIEARCWPALTAHALSLAESGRVEWWLGRVHCLIDSDGLRLRPIGGPPDDRLHIEAEPDSSRLRKLWSGQDILTGDDDFDRVALISGDPGLALALLDREARAGITGGLSMGLILRDGALHLPEVPDTGLIVALAGLAARLIVPEGPLVDAWVRRLATEPVSGAADRLAEVLIASRQSVSLGQLDAAAETGSASAREIIGTAIADRLDAAAVQTLGPAGLAAALDSAPGDLRMPIIERLARVGDERAVAPLTRRASAFLGSGAVKQAARAATEAIIERHGGLRAGGLSVLTEAPTGGLSTPEDSEG